MITPAFLVGAFLLVLAQILLPRKYAFLPLLIAGCHFGFGKIVGDLTIVRLLIIIGMIRAWSVRSSAQKAPSKLDTVFALFSIWMILSSLGHKSTPFNPWTYRLGLAFNILGTYFYARNYLPDIESFRRFVLLLPIVLLPLGAAMTVEKRTQRNYYYIIGADSHDAAVREGKVRAQGPFTHPILAGCAGATALPFAYLLWKMNKRRLAILGFGVFMAITLASSSSGPLAAVAVTGFAVVLWRWRARLRSFIWIAVCLSLVYGLAKGRGPWHIMGSIDLVGGSTGYFRARLIDQSLTYINEWWLTGTDYTRHWMDTGVSWNPDHTDMTNYYIHLGVIGGLPLIIGLVTILSMCFKMIGRRMQELRKINHPDELVLWCVGAALAAHAISFVSISYFDQMYVLFYLLVGAIPGLCHTAGAEPLVKEVTDDADTARQASYA